MCFAENLYYSQEGQCTLYSPVMESNIWGEKLTKDAAV